MFAAITMWRNVTWSSPHSCPATDVFTVAARGQLYINASSPKADPALYVCTGISPFCLRYTSYSPDSTT